MFSFSPSFTCQKLKSRQGLANGLANVSSILPQLWLQMIRNDILSYSEIMFMWAGLGNVSSTV